MVLNIEGMHCEGCVKRVKEGLANVGIQAEVSLEEKTVDFEGDESLKAKVIEEIEDLGFEVVE